MPDYYSIYIGQLSLGVTQSEVKRVFSTCGAVADVHFSEVKPKQQYRYAFVRYFKEEHAEEAIKTYNNWLLGKFRVKVEKGNKKGINKPTVTRVLGEPKSNIPFESRPLPEGVTKDIGGAYRLLHFKQAAWESEHSVERVQLLLRRLNDLDAGNGDPFKECVVRPTGLPNLELCEKLVNKSKDEARMSKTSSCEIKVYSEIPPAKKQLCSPPPSSSLSNHMENTETTNILPLSRKSSKNGVRFGGVHYLDDHVSVESKTETDPTSLVPIIVKNTKSSPVSSNENCNFNASKTFEYENPSIGSAYGNSKYEPATTEPELVVPHIIPVKPKIFDTNCQNSKSVLGNKLPMKNIVNVENINNNCSSVLSSVPIIECSPHDGNDPAIIFARGSNLSKKQLQERNKQEMLEYEKRWIHEFLGPRLNDELDRRDQLRSVEDKMTLNQQTELQKTVACVEETKNNIDVGISVSMGQRKSDEKYLQLSPANPPKQNSKLMVNDKNANKLKSIGRGKLLLLAMQGLGK